VKFDDRALAELQEVVDEELRPAQLDTYLERNVENELELLHPFFERWFVPRRC
jgi:hypothetical protein